MSKQNSLSIGQALNGPLSWPTMAGRGSLCRRSPVIRLYAGEREMRAQKELPGTRFQRGD